jgi:hypothetical protein
MLKMALPLCTATTRRVVNERVGVTLGRNRLNRGGERLAQHLPAEHRSPTEILALTAEQVLFDLFQGEQLHQLVEHAGHHATRSPGPGAPASASSTRFGQAW